MVTVAIIVLVVSLAVPSIVQMFSAGSDNQAYNVLSAQLTAARALAISSATYAGVHLQMGNTTDTAGKCYAAIVWDDPATQGHKFTLAKDFAPSQMPGATAFGRAPFVKDDGSPITLTQGTMSEFTTFTIVFSPTGSVVKSVGAGKIVFDGADPVFGGGAAAAKLWDKPDDEYGVTAMVMFNYSETASSSDPQHYLDTHANGCIPVNLCTGQLFPRQ